jgi:hypothetical protein
LAYAVVVEWSESFVNGRGELTLQIAETDASSSSEWNTDGTGSAVTVRHADSGLEIPAPMWRYRKGTITLTQATLESGTGTDIQPEFGKEDNFTDDQTLIARIGAADAFILEQSLARFTYSKTAYPTEDDVVLHGKSMVNTVTADNVINTELTIVEGHIG